MNIFESTPIIISNNKTKIVVKQKIAEITLNNKKIPLEKIIHEEYIDDDDLYSGNVTILYQNPFNFLKSGN